MDQRKLLEALKEAELLGDENIDTLLQEGKNEGKPAEEIISERHLAPDEDIAKIKSKLLKVPYKKIDPENIDPEVLKLIPAETARKYRMVPMSRDKNMMLVGMVYPDDLAAQEALKYVAKEQKINLGVYLITSSDVNTILRKYESYRSDIQSAVESLNVKPGEGVSEIQKIVRLEEGLGADASEAPVIRIVSSMLKEAVNVGASDIHVEPQRARLRIRFRLDGELQEFMSFPVELQQPIISRIKVLSNLKLDENRTPQDGRFRTRVFEREIDFRVSTFPTPTGEKVALRVLDPKTGLKSLNDLGVVGHNMELINEGIDRPYGMILLTGPTGSGKTTTLYALLQILNKEEVNVVSLEDPVEYTVDGINQSQIRPEINYDFASGLREILRQDPDIIMVGEIRDNETADLAVHAALTGHIVLSTLHTNNSIGVIPRLANMNVERFLLPSVLNLMISQRLVSKLCQKCKVQEDPSDLVKDEIKKTIATLSPELREKYKEPFKIWRSPGCVNCKKKGVAGRVALFEIFQMSHELADLIVKPVLNENEILAEAKRQKIIFLRQDGVMKALDGLVNIDEVLKETELM